jgi:hypothetical protein
MATEKTKGNAATPGDNRGADDVDGNKAGAGAGNKAPGPKEPEMPATDDTRKPRR